MCCTLNARCKSLKLNPQMHISIIEIAGKCILKGHNVCKKKKCNVLSNILFLKISDGFNAYSVTAFHNELSKQKTFRRKRKLHRNRTTNCTNCAGLSRTSTSKYALHTMKYRCGESGKTVCIFISTSSNGNIVRVTGYLCGEFTGHRWSPRTQASDVCVWKRLKTKIRIICDNWLGFPYRWSFVLH